MKYLCGFIHIYILALITLCLLCGISQLLNHSRNSFLRYIHIFLFLRHSQKKLLSCHYSLYIILQFRNDNDHSWTNFIILSFSYFLDSRIYILILAQYSLTQITINIFWLTLVFILTDYVYGLHILPAFQGLPSSNSFSLVFTCNTKLYLIIDS